MSLAGDERAESTSAPLARYKPLLELAESGLQAALRGELRELEDLTGRWDELVAQLPPQPPTTAAPLLERAALVNEAARSRLLALKEGLAHEASVAQRAGRAARGYAVAGGPSTLIERNV